LNKLRGVLEDAIQHGLSQLSGRSILLARVITAEQRGAQVCIQRVVPETEIGKTLDLSAVFQYAQVRIESDFSQCDNYLNTRQ
jgi:hypothetical protein